MGAGESHGAVGVLTVDDKPLFRTAAAAVVEATPGFEALLRRSGAAASVRKHELCPGVLERLWAEHRPH
jgi:hypothetical protein